MATIGETSQSDNHLGIPKAEFLEDVDSFMARDENAKNADLVIRRLEELHKKYRFIEMNLQLRKKRLQSQFMDLKGSLAMVAQLKSKQDDEKALETRFMLIDQVFTNARVAPKTKTVCLWLGANVMLEYPLLEAEQVLLKNRSLADTKLTQIDADLEFLRSQITTTEVNMARVYNWDVKQREAIKKAMLHPSLARK